ncbi:MAG: diguanylate cyclase [Bacillota bacterium]|nr:diguanylate cyclase [Bacillota bacterium]
MNKILNFIVGIFVIPVPEKYKTDFNAEIFKENLIWYKISALILLGFELCVVPFVLILKRWQIFIYPDLYYWFLYLIITIVLVTAYFILRYLEKNAENNLSRIEMTIFTFTGFMLIWGALISILDMHISGQVIVYIITVLAVAVVPVFQPIYSLVLYLPVHIFLMIMMPFYCKTSVLFADYINTNILIILCITVARVRYKSKLSDFTNRMIIQEKCDELDMLNKELSDTNKKLEKITQTDALTGIYNRFKFDKTLKSEWSRCKKGYKPLTVIMLDIDYFKEYNDNYGHIAGDECIRQIARILKDCISKTSGIVARYGGDEFGIILPETSREEAARITARINEKISQYGIPHAYSLISDYVTLSLGLYTVIPTNQLSVEKIVRYADRELYGTKYNKKNQKTINKYELNSKA